MTGRCERNALATKLAEAQQITDRLTESECDKIMAMTDDQIAAALRLEGRDPKDVATIGRQAVEIATLRVELTAALARAEAAEKDAERYRWLRDTPGMPLFVVQPQQDEGGFWHECIMQDHHLDAAIDAAMKERP